MMDEQDLIDFVTKAALLACNGDVTARRKALWDSCIAIMADCLRTSDEFTRERLLARLEDRLREGVVELNQLLRPTTPCNPFKLN
jgi:hypothetical protein